MVRIARCRAQSHFSCTKQRSNPPRAKASESNVEQFQTLLKELHEPFATMALLCVCFGLRVSEALALRWSDVDCLGSRIHIRRGIVKQHVDECKTEISAKTFVWADNKLTRLGYGDRERGSVPQMIGRLRAPSSSGCSRTPTPELNRNLHEHRKRRESVA